MVRKTGAIHIDRASIASGRPAGRHDRLCRDRDRISSSIVRSQAPAHAPRRRRPGHCMRENGSCTRLRPQRSALVARHRPRIRFRASIFLSVDRCRNSRDTSPFSKKSKSRRRKLPIEVRELTWCASTGPRSRILSFHYAEAPSAPATHERRGRTGPTPAAH